MLPVALVLAFSGGCARPSSGPESTAAPSAALSSAEPQAPSRAPAAPAPAATPAPGAASAAEAPSTEIAQTPARLASVGKDAGSSSKLVGPPRTRAACDACKGLWARHGVAEQESCNCRTRDAGKKCRDGRECQGDCLADAPTQEVVTKGPPARGYFIGKCSEFQTAFGCHRLLEDGVAAEGPTNLSELPREMCID